MCSFASGTMAQVLWKSDHAVILPHTRHARTRGDCLEGNVWLEEYERLLRSPAPDAFQHAVELKDRHRPASLFRYRVVDEFALDSVRRGYVWLSHPQSFNDGYDSAICVDHWRCMAVSFRRGLRKVIAQH